MALRYMVCERLRPFAQVDRSGFRSLTYNNLRSRHTRWVILLKPSSCFYVEYCPVLLHYNCCVVRCASTKSEPEQKKTQDDDLKGSFLEKVLEERSHVPSTTVEKVKQASKDVSYTFVILVGLGVTGTVLYAIFSELFSKKSPNVIYKKAFNIVKNDERIRNVCGTPLKGYGEMTRRGRRRYPSHVEYVKDGVNYLRMKFYVEGPNRKGTVQLEVKENESGKYVYRYLFVELEGIVPEVIIIEDNR